MPTPEEAVAASFLNTMWKLHAEFRKLKLPSEEGFPFKSKIREWLLGERKWQPRGHCNGTTEIQVAFRMGRERRHKGLPLHRPTGPGTSTLGVALYSRQDGAHP